MALDYSINYKAENDYQNSVDEAHWQFLIVPEQNSTQQLLSVDFRNSLGLEKSYSINGFGFRTIRLHATKKFGKISFEASFKLIKKDINPFDFDAFPAVEEEYQYIKTLDFQVDFEPFLKTTRFTRLPEAHLPGFQLDQSISLFENLQQLNEWTFKFLNFETGVTDVNTELDEVIRNRKGVCQDFTHLFCALARQNGVPVRYVSGYLHQGNGYFGDSQMHAWAEAFMPSAGWIGFDPTNNLLVNSNYIKVSHGKDYRDCSPLKGVVYSEGANETKYSVEVSAQQQ
ncbi:transglutaminase-like domain-containing protein [Poritiphilus flavus]|uniref:Transglutaminase family protein n=1 Tax=Poritiphilus flavus TaxID=2697053 RepID=A0A6L9EFU8_9FLAO|nr:transglutaminase family protein [Poritiphilus flavus]NAS13472.1 transglutaminase family protein [Poritiphilus flavus]